MSLVIETTPNISLQDIVTEQQQGTSVIRSAHVGNARGYNLALAELGIPFLLVDHTIVASQPGQAGDKNYLPGSIVTLEGVNPLAVSGLGGLSLKTTVECPDTKAILPLDTLHTRAFQAAFPDTTIATNTEYLRSEEVLAQDVITTATQVAPELFTRKVEIDGTITPATVDDIKRYGILQLNDDPRTERGVLIPNEVDIVINFLIEAIKSGTDTQIHLAGPDMPGYMKKPETISAITQLYQAAARRLAGKYTLPETAIVKLVPSHYAEFVTTQDRAQHVAAVFEAFDPSQQNPRNQPDCTEALQDAPELLIDVRNAPYVSQYDVLRSGGIWMPEENRTYTMTQLRTLAKRLRKIKGQQLCQTQQLEL